MNLCLALILLAEVTLTPVTRSLTWKSDGCAGESMAVVSGCPSQQT